MSQSEPELGLGMLIQAEEDRVHLLFSAADEQRQYARDDAPIQRVRFRVGDHVTTLNGQEILVATVTEDDGLLIYHGEGISVSEDQLSDRISFSRPETRLFNGRWDDNITFELRQTSLNRHFRHHQSPTLGFVGGRVDLIPHQLYIAQELSERYAPRVLLSDEVGLGKTVEAGLILHRLLVSEQVERVLIVVPESLVHQWFVEMLRKFNLHLSLFDEERCRAIENQEAVQNPFLDDQQIICSVRFMANSPARLRQAADAEWDILVVDEAHHLEWSETAPSAEYQAVEALAQQTEGLLLLTATPEQLGVQSHFARLRLLDPERYPDYESFAAQSADWQAIATIAEKLADEKPLSPTEQKALGKRLRQREAPPASDADRLNDLLDFHGPGRVIFRNTRNVIRGFPKRVVHLIRLPEPQDLDACLDHLATEFAVDAGDCQLTSPLPLKNDPRISWLAKELRRLAPQKILLICSSRDKVEAIDESLRRLINVKTALFHEGLTLMQRDRNAAWFAEEGGARLLICSEIGSEGRNFQFAHHLVLFDLPFHPELLEQRIGRLDRIGQTENIHIHLPYLPRSPQEVLSRWHHEGLDSLENHLVGGHDLIAQFGQWVHDFALEYPALTEPDAQAELTSLIDRTRQARVALLKRLHEGRDRLLELNSFRRPPALLLKRQIEADDRDDSLDSFMAWVFDHFGVKVEELAPRTYRLDSAGAITDAFPFIPRDGLQCTFDRRRALSREDIAFLTWDHPMVSGSLDLILSSEAGNCCLAIWPEAEESGLWIQTVFVLDAVAPGRWHVNRFLPLHPIRVIVDHRLQPIPEQRLPAYAWTDDLDTTQTETTVLKDAANYRLPHARQVQDVLFPQMLEAAKGLAQVQADQIIAEAQEKMTGTLDREINRLTTLSKINDHVRPLELQLAETRKNHLSQAISEASLRLDSIRLIVRQVAGA